MLIYRKPFLEIFSDNPEEPAIIVSDRDPCITISGLKSEEVVKLENLRLMNRGVRHEDSLKEADLAKK